MLPSLTFLITWTDGVTMEEGMRISCCFWQTMYRIPFTFAYAIWSAMATRSIFCSMNTMKSKGL